MIRDIPSYDYRRQLPIGQNAFPLTHVFAILYPFCDADEDISCADVPVDDARLPGLVVCWVCDESGMWAQIIWLNETRGTHLLHIATADR